MRWLVHERGSSGPCGRCMKVTVFVTEYEDSNEDRCKGRFSKAATVFSSTKAASDAALTERMAGVRQQMEQASRSIQTMPAPGYYRR